MKMKMIWRTEELDLKEEEERSEDDLKNRRNISEGRRRMIWKTQIRRHNLENAEEEEVQKRNSSIINLSSTWIPHG